MQIRRDERAAWRVEAMAPVFATTNATRLTELTAGPMGRRRWLFEERRTRVPVRRA